MDIFMKKPYKDLELAITLFENQDVVTTSALSSYWSSDNAGDNDKAWTDLIKNS